MSESLNRSLKQWTLATSRLDWGVQHVMHDTLTLVSEGKVHMVYGANYRNGKPCLVNAVRPMVNTSDNVAPIDFAPDLVSMFDRINSELQTAGVNDSTGYVSELAAEILLRHFAPLKTPVVETQQVVIDAGVPYIEPTDAALADAWLQAMKAPAPSELSEPAKDDVDKFNKDFIVGQMTDAIFNE